MRITTAICTLNRAESLRTRTLESLTRMRVPQHVAWEVIVVNNGCSDHTDLVVAAFADRLPIRREFEAERGLSHARNRAVDAAQGDYILWTDDDVVVDSGWLAAYAEAFQRWPDAAIFGGPIIPKYDIPVVEWVLASEPLLDGPYGIRDLGDKPLPLSVIKGHDPWGANFAVRMLEQRAFRYDPRLGIGPGRRRLGEETDVIERILNSGATGYWVPGARLEHRIGHEHQTVAHITQYFIGQGEARAYREGRDGVKLWFGVPRRLWHRLFGRWMLYRVHRFISPPPVWVGHLAGYATTLGAIRYWRSCASGAAQIS